MCDKSQEPEFTEEEIEKWKAAIARERARIQRAYEINKRGKNRLSKTEELYLKDFLIDTFSCFVDTEKFGNRHHLLWRKTWINSKPMRLSRGSQPT